MPTMQDDRLTGPGPDPTEDARGVGEQVVHATLVTLGTLIAVAAIIGAFLWLRPPATELWARAFGDPDLWLAEGTALPAERMTVELPVLASQTWDAADVAALAAPFAGSPRVLTTYGELEALAPDTTSIPASGPSAPLDLLTVAVPAGIITVVGDATYVRGGVPVRVSFTGGPAAPVLTSAAERQAFVESLYDAWSVLGLSTVDGSSVSLRESAPAVPAGTFWPIDVTLAGGCATCVVRNGDGLVLGDDGRVVSADVTSVAVVGSRPVALLSASEVLDGIRHHRAAGAILVPEETVTPIVGARLETYLIGGWDGSAAIPVEWVFVDAAGRPVAAGAAEPGRSLETAGIW